MTACVVAVTFSPWRCPTYVRRGMRCDIVLRSAAGAVSKRLENNRHDDPHFSSVGETLERSL
jgi:hypothetical protein